MENKNNVILNLKKATLDTIYSFTAPVATGALYKVI